MNMASPTPAARTATEHRTLGSIFGFEWRYQTRTPLFIIACVMFFSLAFMATTSEHVTVGVAKDNLNFNAGFLIFNSQFVFSIIAMLLSMVFAAGPITRDVQLRTAEMLYATPLRPIPLLLGRFSAAYLVALTAATCGLIGEAAGTFAWWLAPERVQPFTWAPYAYAFSTILVPNIFLECALFFSLAAWSRSAVSGYVAAVALLGITMVAGANTDQENLRIAALLDPFGYAAFGLATRYWSVYEKNSAIPEITSLVLSNRALWLGFAAATLAWVTASYKLNIDAVRKSKFEQQTTQVTALSVAPRGPSPAARDARAGSSSSRR